MKLSNVDFVGIHVGPVKGDRQWPTFHLYTDIRAGPYFNIMIYAL